MDLDLALPNYVTDNLSVLLNSGCGTFETQALYDAGDGPYCVAMGDLDGDIDLDLVVANSNSTTVSVLLNLRSVPCHADLDGSGDVGISDLLTLLGNWGPCP